MKTLLLFHTQFLVLLVGAQTDFHFADSTAQWQLLATYSGPPFTALVVYNVESDTSMNGKMYQSIIGRERRYLRRDSAQRVYLRSPDAFAGDTSDYLLYDFGKRAGDTIKNPGSQLCGPVWCVVDSVDNVLLGRYRKRMFVTWHGGIIGHDVWIDGIGAALSHFLSVANSCPVTPEDPGYELLCFFEHGQSLFHNNNHNEYSCNLVSSVNEHPVDPIARIFPNPVSGNAVEVDYNNTTTTSLFFRLLDLGGRMLLQKELTEKAMHISLQGISDGLYIYEISSPSQIINCGKLVVQ
jgi:hypothetical protein